MASKVNTRFVVMLSAALLVAFAAVVYVAYQSILKSGDDYVNMGDKAMAEGKYTDAVGMYAKAVNKDQRNGPWIRKWIEAMEKDTPQGRAAYSENYFKQYLTAIRALAEADHTDYEASRRLLNERWELLRMRLDLKGLEEFIPFVEETVNAFNGDEAQKRKLWRYRGLARVGMLNFNSDLSQEILNGARKDLEGAVAADPADKDSVVSLCVIDLTQGDRARKRDDKEDLARFNAAAQDRIARFIADHPPAAAGRLAELQMIVKLAAQAADRPVTTAEVLQDRQPRVEELVAAVLAEDPAMLDVRVVTGAATLARAVLPEARGKEATQQMLAHLLKGQPNKPEVLSLMAGFELENGDTAGALARYQQIVDLPDQPMSLSGLRLFLERSQAVQSQTFVAFRMWETETDLAKKAAAAELAKTYRKAFVERVGESDNSVLSIDARLALISGDLKGATTLLTRYNQQTNERDALSVSLLANLQMQQGNTGAARKAFERVVQLDDTAPELRFRAATALVDITTKAQEYAEALRYATIAAKMRPENQELQQQVATLEQLAGGRINDKVLLVLAKAQNELAGPAGDPAKAEAILREGLANLKSEPPTSYQRLHVALIQLLSRGADKPALTAAIDAALADFPEGDFADRLKKIKAGLAVEDPVQSALAQVDAANATPLAKHVRRYEILTMANRPDDAAKELAAAATIAPEDPQVVDYLFEDAIRRKDTAKLAELASLAESKNLDQVGGQLYRARLLMIEGTTEKLNDAAQLLRNVVDRDRNNFLGWRLLGGVRMALAARSDTPDADRRTHAEAAVDSFGKAMEIRPEDVLTINGYLASLVMTDRSAEALAVARKARNVASSNLEFVERLIQLEFSAPGGNPAEAVRLRETLARLRPENTANRVSLARLQIEQKEWDAAKATIDALRDNAELKDTVASLDAMFLAKQGRFDEAQKIVDEYIAGIPKDKLNEDPYLGASRLFVSVGQVDRAIAYLEKGRAVQDPKQLILDREMGDVCFTARKIPEAIAAYSRVLAAGSPDKGDAVAKRLLESYLTTKEWAKFDEVMSSLGERALKDSTLLVLAAEAASAQDDAKRASDLYDKAVAADQKNYVVFLKRGDFYAKDPARVRDAIADYEQAAILNPTSAAPPLRLADLYVGQGKITQALEQLKKALAISPADDGLRDKVIQIHMARGEEDAVVDLVEQAVKLKPESIAWLLRGGELMGALGRTDRAIEYLGRAWERDKTLRTAIPYVTAMLSNNPPDLNTSVKIVNDPALANSDPMPRHMLRAMALLRNKQVPEAEAEVAQAVAKFDHNDFAKSELFIAGLDSAYMNVPDEIAVLSRIEAKTPFTGFLKVQSLMLRMREPSTSAQAAADLESLADAHPDAQVRAAVYRLLATFRFETGDPAKSVATYRKLLALQPDDAGSLNNCAYIMATGLKQPSEALPLAEKAASLAPDSATVLDTLATVHLELNHLDRAAEIARGALDKATSDNEKVPLLIHAAKALVLQGKKPEAQGLLDEARKIMEKNPGLDRQYGPDLKELARQIDGQ